jgi:hypothetical protein
MIWHTNTLRKYMQQYYNQETSRDDPDYAFIEKLKELWGLIDQSEIEKFTGHKHKIYDLYPLRNELETIDDGNNRFNMEQMADAGEAYGELLNIIFEKWEGPNIAIKLEKHFTCKCGKTQTFPLDDSCMMLILIADLFMADHIIDERDSNKVLMDRQGKFPMAVRQFLTGGLVFLEKEHLKKCQYQPEDWEKKLIRLKTPGRPSVTSLGSSKSSLNSEAPDLLSFNMTWSQSDQSQILTILTMIPSKFKLSDMFELSPGISDKQYYFKGMI